MEELTLESDGMNNGRKNGLFGEATECESLYVQIKNLNSTAQLYGLRAHMGLGTKPYPQVHRLDIFWRVS